MQQKLIGKWPQQQQNLSTQQSPSTFINQENLGPWATEKYTEITTNIWTWKWPIGFLTRGNQLLFKMTRPWQISSPTENNSASTVWLRSWRILVSWLKSQPPSLPVGNLELFLQVLSCTKYRPLVSSNSCPLESLVKLDPHKFSFWKTLPHTFFLSSVIESLTPWKNLFLKHNVFSPLPYAYFIISSWAKSLTLNLQSDRWLGLIPNPLRSVVEIGFIYP